MQLILGVPSTRKVKSEPISDGEKDNTLSLKDRKELILAKFDVINDKLNSNLPKSFDDFRKVIVYYKERF